MSRHVASACVLSLFACGAPPTPKTVSMRVVGSPPHATVTVDDIFVGRLDVVSLRGVALPPGRHRVSVEADGYFPSDTLIEAKEGQAYARLDVVLAPVPD